MTLCFFFDTCLANALRVFFDSQNNEPFVYVNTQGGDIWSTTSFTAKVGLDMSCLLFEGSYIIQAEDVSDSPKCFSEIGGYLYDATHPIIPQGVCGSVSVTLNVWARFSRISF